MTHISLNKTDLKVHPLCLGGNVFGWSADEAQSFAVLNAYTEHNGNFIDTADVYSEWKDGNKGHDSETILGKWMKERGNRSEIVIATKVAKLSTRPGLSAANINAAVDDSLRALQTDYIDIYYAHEDDQSTPLRQTLEAFDGLVKSGKVRYIAASNYTGARLTEALEISKAEGFASYVALQNHYNLLERSEFESDAAPVVIGEGISAIPYFGLARGFLTGKYRQGETVDSVRASGVATYQTEGGYKVVSLLHDIAKTHNTTIASVALGWLAAQPGVSTPIASARTVEQLEEIVNIAKLSSDEISELSELTK
jgi:aryl-alcohol dehydrogenase-like predicted oxidoreductase